MTMERIEICGPQDCTCPNDHPELDEFVAERVDVHFEALGTCQWYMHITDRDGRMWQVDFGAVNPRVRGYARIEEIPPVSASHRGNERSWALCARCGSGQITEAATG